ncbi:hypothetical protein PWG71_09830 [Nocardiopsis sp. N85]|nr:hypothetical protein [Nocardiopsis sp. N85]
MVTLEFVRRNLTAPDLCRRGLPPSTAPLAVLLLDIEADFAVLDGDRAILAEQGFPVAEPARALTVLLNSHGGGTTGDFVFESMSYAEPGAVRIVAFPDGWRVGSALEPDTWSVPLDQRTLTTVIGPSGPLSAATWPPWGCRAHRYRRSWSDHRAIPPLGRCGTEEGRMISRYPTLGSGSPVSGDGQGKGRGEERREERGRRVRPVPVRRCPP